MRDAILIGALYAALGAIVAALAVKYAAPSALWDIMLWGGVALAIGCVASLWFSASHQATGRPFLLPSACITLGLCLIAFGFVWHASQAAVDNEYIFFRVEISDPKNLSLTNLPVWITNASPGPFEHVDSWFAPWTPQPDANDPSYWSIGHQLKRFIPVLQNGSVLFGVIIPRGNYRIQYDATLRGLSYHFEEHLNIFERDGSLVQTIEVLRRISGVPKMSALSRLL
jgi:hypothetical protein